MSCMNWYLHFCISLKETEIKLHCKVIIGRNPIEANANTVAIQLPGNPVAYIGKCFTPYQEFLQPLQVNYHLLANYPQKLKQFPVQAKGFADRSVKYLYYTYNLPIYIYSVDSQCLEYLGCITLEILLKCTQTILVVLLLCSK